MRKRRRLSLFVIRSYVNKDPPNAHQAQYRPKPRRRRLSFLVKIEGDSLTHNPRNITATSTEPIFDERRWRPAAVDALRVSSELLYAFVTAPHGYHYGGK